MTSPPRKLINPLDPTTIHPFDVVFGKKTRGNFCAPGNKLFQRYLQSRRNEYAAEKRAIGKRSILESCIQDWRNITGGRFLLRDDSWWCDEIIFCKPKSRTTTDSVDNNQGETPDDYLLKKFDCGCCRVRLLHHYLCLIWSPPERSPKCQAVNSSIPSYNQRSNVLFRF